MVHLQTKPRFAIIAFDVFICNFILNALASFVTLSLIFTMRKAGHLKLNLYTKCVTLMSFNQLVYEIFDVLYISEAKHVTWDESKQLGNSSTVRVLGTGGALWGGIGASTWAFMLLLGALFTVHSGRQPSHKEQIVVGVLINVLLIGFSIYGMIVTHVAWHEGTYSDFRHIWIYYRIIRIVLIVLSSVCLLYLYQVMLQTSIKGERFRSPLFHLLKKIAPYVIILMVVRFGGSSYQWIYGETVYRIPANADGWQIFWMYVYVLLLPAASIGLMISFLKVTAGAKRSLIQMLHLECIFTLPPAPVIWADREEAKRTIGEFRLDGESTMRPTMAQEAHDR